MATATFVESGSERSSKRLLYFFKYSHESFKTKAQLDQARAALCKSRDLLSSCDQDALLKAHEMNGSLDGTVQVLSRLHRERTELGMDLNLMEAKDHNLTTVFKARRLRLKSESHEKRARRASEGVRSVVNDQFQMFLLEQRQFKNSGPSSLPDNKPLREDSEHPQLTAENNTVEVETISKMIREVALTASQSPTGNIIFIQNSCIHQNSSISHSSLNQNAGDKSTPVYTCPYCSPTLSFDSPTKLTVHLDEAHGVRKQEIEEGGTKEHHNCSSNSNI